MPLRMPPTAIIHLQRYHSPCGDLLLGAFGERLCLCDWAVEGRRALIGRRLQKGLHATCEERPTPLLDEAAEQLDSYFARKRTYFTLPLLFVGSDFQQAVWQHLLEIPYGATCSYGELARRLGHPSSVRAVANASGANTLSIFVPCHRVIGSDRSLTGYAGGLRAKRFLLQLESNAATLF